MELEGKYIHHMPRVGCHSVMCICKCEHPDPALAVNLAYVGGYSRYVPKIETPAKILLAVMAFNIIAFLIMFHYGAFKPIN